MRCDFNVPLDENRNITSDDRIVKALPTIKHILKKGGALILMSHLGRPKGVPEDAFSLRPVAERLSELLGQEVVFAADCVGPDAKAKAKALKAGQCLLLENVRFYKEETIKDKAAKEDAQLRQAKDTRQGAGVDGRCLRRRRLRDRPPRQRLDVHGSDGHGGQAPRHRLPDRERVEVPR